MGSMSLAHWLVVGLVVTLVFGPRRLAQAGKGLGEGIRGFKVALGTEEPKASDRGADADRSSSPPRAG